MSKSPNVSRRKAVKTPDMAAAAPSLPARADFDLHIPLLSRAIFWRPRHLAASPDLPLLPSLYWLLEAIEPARSLQIGLGDGVAYLALCQAIDKLGLEASVTGLEPREGMNALPTAMAEQHRLAYRDFSHVMAANPADVAQRMTTSEIDLLLINCPLDAPLIEAVSTLFLPQLSARAVIVVLNPQQNANSPEAQALLKAHLKQEESVTCDYGDSAMLVALHGPSQPDRLRRLTSLNHNEPSFLAAMQIFRRLGDAMVQEWQVIDQGGQTSTVEQEIGQLKKQIADSAAALEKSKAEVAAAVAGERQQAGQLGKLQARLFDADEAQAKSADLSRKLEASLAQNKQDQATHSDEIRRLTEGHAEALSKVHDKLGQAETTLTDLNARISALELDPKSALEDIVAEHKARQTALAAAQARAEAAERELALERSNLSKRLAAAETEWRQNADHSRDLEAQYNARVEDIIALTAAHKDELKTVADQTKAQHTAFVEAQNARKRHWQALETLRPQLRAEKERVANLTRALSEQHKVFEQEKRALMSSTSWKVTKPLRGLGNSLRRNKQD